MVAHIKFIMPLFHSLIAKRAGKKYIVGDTGAGYAGKNVKYGSKKIWFKM